MAVQLKFTTRAFTTGILTTLAGTPAISIYKDDSDTQSQAGVTLEVDFDSVAGHNLITVDTSADGTFYSSDSDFFAVITTGTVGGVSVVGEVVGGFDIQNRFYGEEEIVVVARRYFVQHTTHRKKRHKC